MKRIKIYVTMITTVLLLMLCSSLNVFALTDGDWEFQLLDNEVMITGYLGAGGDVVIPEMIYGQPVTRVEIEKFGLENAVSVTFPKTVKVIHDCGWGNKLETVVLPEGVEEITGSPIWNHGFAECVNLKNIVLPSTLKVIGDKAFKGCTSLKSINLPEGLEKIGGYSFSYSGLMDVDLTNIAATIGDSVFSGCLNLRSAKLPDTMVELPGSMFRGCGSLIEIDIPNSVEKIGNGAFEGCSSLKNLILPTSLKVLGGNSVNAPNIEEIVIPYGTEEIGILTDSDALKAIYVPDSVVEPLSYFVSNCPNAIVYCTDGSMVQEYCRRNDISYITDNSVNSGITVLYNGTRISFHSYGQNPELLNGRTLVPLRSIFETMGANVQWDGATSTAIAKRGNVEVKITIGASEIYKNGKAIPVDVPAMLLNSRTMVPARVIAEAFGADVDWNGNGRVVLITE